MPELPEVETIKRYLEKELIGLVLTTVDVYLERQIKNIAAEDFVESLSGKKLSKINRKGKYLLLGFSDDLYLIVHLRMTGRLIIIGKGEELPEYYRVVFYFANGQKLAFCDLRTFGTLELSNFKDLALISGLCKMGKEPLSLDFTLSYFREGLKKTTKKIKSILLEQSFIAGLGNIYVDESLFLAGIDAERKANDLSKKEEEKLYETIKKVLQEAVNNQGTTFRDYRAADGSKGKHQECLFVYGRKNKACRKCGSLIKYKKVAGRGTHYCFVCQK